MHAVGGIRRADVDVHQHTLTASGHEGESARHVCRRVLMRAADHRRQLFAEHLLVRHLLDDRRVIGTEIAEQVFDADLVEAFEKVVRSRKFRFIAGVQGGRGHD